MFSVARPVSFQIPIDGTHKHKFVIHGIIGKALIQAFVGHVRITTDLHQFFDIDVVIDKKLLEGFPMLVGANLAQIPADLCYVVTLGVIEVLT